jgi:hypothetical protein
LIDKSFLINVEFLEIFLPRSKNNMKAININKIQQQNAMGFEFCFWGMF